MAEEQFEFPEDWGMTPQQDFFIGTLIDNAGSFVSVYAICEGLWPDDNIDDGMNAPTKLRVLKRGCQKFLDELTASRVDILTRRNSGYKITMKHAMRLRNMVA